MFLFDVQRYILVTILLFLCYMFRDTNYVYFVHSYKCLCLCNFRVVHVNDSPPAIPLCHVLEDTFRWSRVFYT